MKELEKIMKMLAEAGYEKNCKMSNQPDRNGKHGLYINCRDSQYVTENDDGTIQMQAVGGSRYSYPHIKTAEECAKVMIEQCGKTTGDINKEYRALWDEMLRDKRNGIKRYQVIEDNGGGLTLVVFGSNNNVEYLHDGYEHNPGQLQQDLKALRDGDDPANDWEGNAEDPQAMYDNITSYEYGWEIVADNDGIYPDKMGAAARIEFNVKDGDEE